MKSVFISDIVSWIPEFPTQVPKLEFIDPIFKRRLSQITKMTIQVVHELLEKNPLRVNSKLVFASLRGEIQREFTINKRLIEDEVILPAAFALSVFNMPVAISEIALGMRGGYTAEFPANGNFADALLCAAAPVLSGEDEKILFVYADEKVPDVYGDKIPCDAVPLAFGMEISSKPSENSQEIKLEDLTHSPVEFLRAVI